MKGTIAGDDVTDYLDQRDSIVSKLSQEVGVTVGTRANGDTVLYTDSGVMLFDTRRRGRSASADQRIYRRHDRKCRLYRRRAGHRRIRVMPIKTASSPASAALRDDVTVTYQSQLDEVARGLIETFKESDQTAAALPDIPGLFTYPGAPAIPPTGVSPPAWPARSASTRRSIRPRAAIRTC